MRAPRRSGEQRHADAQQEQHAEAEPEIAPAHAGHGGLERSARVLHQQAPASQLLVTRRPRFRRGQTALVVRSGGDAEPHAGSTAAAEKEPLSAAAKAEEDLGGVGAGGIHRRARVRFVEHARRCGDRHHRHAVAVAVLMNEEAARERRQDLLLHVAHVELDDREAENRRDRRRTAAGPGRANQVAERADDERLVVGKGPAAVERHAGIEVPQLALEFWTPPLHRLGPRHGLERVRRRIEPPDPELGVGRIHQKDVGNELRVLGRVHPGLVPIGVLLRGAVAGGNRADLQAENGAAHLEIEGVAELRGGVAQVVLHPLALGLADLTDPAVLQHRQRRQQHQERRSEQGETRRAGELHEAECSTEENAVKYLIRKLLHS